MLVAIALVLQFVFGLTIIVRATQQVCVSRYPFFHSYLGYFLLTGAVDLGVDSWAPQHYPAYFWIKFLTLVVAEFALVLEINDHLFAPYRMLRELGRIATLAITGGFSAIYILPPLIERRPSEVAIYDLVLRSAFTKGCMILVLGVMAACFRVLPGRHVTGIATGLMSFLCISIANFSLVESLGWNDYGPVFTVVGPVSHALMLFIWTVSLWKHEQPAILKPAEEPGESLPDRLGRYNTTLERLLRR